jgi:hypothetical protein
VDIVEIPDAGIDLAGFLEGSIERLELAGRAHLVDRIVDGRDGGERPIDGNGMRRQADAALIGQLLELGYDHAPVGPVAGVEFHEIGGDHPHHGAPLVIVGTRDGVRGVGAWRLCFKLARAALANY